MLAILQHLYQYIVLKAYRNYQQQQLKQSDIYTVKGSNYYSNLSTKI